MGLTFEKMLIILLIAVFVVGPDRLPLYAAKLAQLVRSLRNLASGAKDRMREEMGPEFDEVDWRKLDPRQYDPRRIIRDALLEDQTPAARRARATTGGTTAASAGSSQAAGDATGAASTRASASKGSSAAASSSATFDEEAT